MFLKEALLRCSRLEGETASIYADLAALPTVAPEAAAAWSECSRREKRRADLMLALSRLSEALDDDGPFLVQVPVQLAALQRTLASARRSLEHGGDERAANRCADLLDSAPARDLHAGLLEVVEPEARRLVRLVSSEIKNTRRGRGGKTRQREASRASAACTGSTT